MTEDQKKEASEKANVRILDLIKELEIEDKMQAMIGEIKEELSTESDELLSFKVDEPDKLETENEYCLYSMDAEGKDGSEVGILLYLTCTNTGGAILGCNYDISHVVNESRDMDNGIVQESRRTQFLDISYTWELDLDDIIPIPPELEEVFTSEKIDEILADIKKEVLESINYFRELRSLSLSRREWKTYYFNLLDK